MITKCKNCGKNKFYIEEISSWTGELDIEEGKLKMFLSRQEPQGFSEGSIYCLNCGEPLPEDLEFEIEY
jgi:hypothetical protein